MEILAHMFFLVGVKYIYIYTMMHPETKAKASENQRLEDEMSFLWRKRPIFFSGELLVSRRVQKYEYPPG